MKKIAWLGDTHETVKKYPVNVRREIGYNLDKVQRGFDPADWKPIVEVGQGVKEIRIHEENEYRVLYVAFFLKHTICCINMIPPIFTIILPIMNCNNN